MFLTTIYCAKDTYINQIFNWLNEYYKNNKDIHLALSLCFQKDRLSNSLKDHHIDLIILSIKDDASLDESYINKIKDNNNSSEIIILGKNKTNPFKNYLYANDKNSFLYAVNKAISNLVDKGNNVNIISINSIKGLVKVAYSQIIYIEYNNKRLKFVLNDGRIIVSRSIRLSMEEYLKDLLKDQRFVRCHSGFIINLDSIVKIEKNSALMENGVIVPISRQRKKELLVLYTQQNNINSLYVNHLNSALKYCLTHSKQLDFIAKQPFAQCIIRVDVDSNKKPFDFVFMYVNDKLCKLEGKTSDELMGTSFYDVFNNGDNKWLSYYYDSAYNNIDHEFKSYSPEIDKNLEIVCYQIELGYCGCILKEV